MHLEKNKRNNSKKESYFQLFLRFLKFGFLAWGGPIAQIDMIRQELVEEKRWISRKKFNRILAVYQALPGPEATELSVYFGMLKGGRLGGFLAGLAFMLPGFFLMFVLSWFYVTFGIVSSILAAVFFGIKAAVGALLVRAVHHIGINSVTNRRLFVSASIGGMGYLLNANFIITLLIAGFAYILLNNRRYLSVVVLTSVFLISTFYLTNLANTAEIVQTSSSKQASFFDLFIAGLRSGLFTYGGAYTVIPFLQHDAVIVGNWMTNNQFLDGIALSSVLPAPMVIFGTFVGYLGGGPLGALLLTLGIFIPAFGFTLIGFGYVQRLAENKPLSAFLEGLTAGVIGLIAMTTIGLFYAAIPNLSALFVFALALLALYRLKSKAIIAIVMMGAGILGLLLFQG